MSPARRQALTQYVGVLVAEGVVKLDGSTGENAMHVATAVARDFGELAVYEPAKSKVADAFDGFARFLRGGGRR